MIPGFLAALEKEIEFRTSYLQNEEVGTIYLGGGTPSLLNISQINRILDKIMNHFAVTGDCEFTLEANPDDLTPAYINELKSETPVNRLSIGIQSFNDRDLRLLNRRHSAAQAIDCILNAQAMGFNNISIDLIYGIPGMVTQEWQKNLDALPEVEHISAYHLTIEPGTALAIKASRGLLSLTGEEESTAQFALLEQLENRGFKHYEISNLAREGYMSKHNSNYWLKQKYLGLGPSAHSFDQVTRQWNVSDLKKYIESLLSDGPYFEQETLSMKDHYNEYIMLSLRTIWGVNSVKLRNDFGDNLQSRFIHAIQPYINSEHIIANGNQIIMTKKGWLISDYIISDLVY